jgi:hypothetical protein
MATEFKRLDPAAYAAGPTENIRIRQEEGQVGLEGDVLGNVQKKQDIKKGAATLPYEGATAAAQLNALQLRNEELERQIKKAEKGEPLAADDKTRLITDVDAYERLISAINKFDPDYVGTVLDFPGEIETAIQKRVNSDFGTPGQADFWSQMKFLDMLTRNKYFGASLTPAEKASYAETTIAPGYTGDTALTNLKRRAETVRTGIQRNVRGLVEGGYRPAQINAQLGRFLPDLNPRWLSPENERLLGEYASQKDFDPKVYGQMMLRMADASGIRIDPAGAEAAANTIAAKRAEGVTSFGGAGIYEGVTAPPEEKRDETDAVATPTGQGPIDGDGGGDGGGLSFGEALGSALVNLPRSTAEELGGIFEAFTSPIQTAKSVGALGGALLSKMGVADFDESSADALGEYYANKYGSIEGFKKELANNPASILADAATILTAGAGIVTKLGLPAKIAKLGPRATVAQQWAGNVARNIDPITAMTNVVTKAVPATVKGATNLAGRAVSNVLGTTTGAGGDAVRKAARVGFDRSTAGTPTIQADTFLDAMRRPGASADELVQLARDGVTNLRQQASQRYLDKMQQFGRNPVPLDITNVRQRIAGIKPKSYDTWRDSQGPRPADHRAWETMNQFVDEYAYKATQDPALLDPLAVDQFKQDLYDVGSKVGGAYDRDAARIAGTAYGAVKDELVKHDPLYADAMKDYENAAKEAQKLETTFSLAAARGKQPNIESAGRKLTSIFRNNVNTNFGSRTEQAKRLSELDPSGKLFPTLAGQSLSSTLPRGIQGAFARAGATAGLTGIGLDMIPMALDVPGYLSGYNLAALPLSSPRLIGEAAYYGGRGAGATSKALEPVTSRVGDAADFLSRKQKQYRTPLVGAGFAGMNIEALQEPDIRYDPETKTYILPDGRRVFADGTPADAPEGMYRGGLMDLARKYR